MFAAIPAVMISVGTTVLPVRGAAVASSSGRSRGTWVSTSTPAFAAKTTAPNAEACATDSFPWLRAAGERSSRVAEANASDQVIRR